MIQFPCVSLSLINKSVSMFKKIFLSLVFILNSTPRVLATSAVNPAIDNSPCERIARRTMSFSSSSSKLSANTRPMIMKFVFDPYNADTLYQLIDTIKRTNSNQLQLILATKSELESQLHRLPVCFNKDNIVFAKTLRILSSLKKNCNQLDKIDLLEIYGVKEHIMVVVNAIEENSSKDEQTIDYALKTFCNSHWSAYGDILFVQAIDYASKVMKKTLMDKEHRKKYLNILCNIIDLLCPSCSTSSNENVDTSLIFKVRDWCGSFGYYRFIEIKLAKKLYAQDCA